MKKHLFFFSFLLFFCLSCTVPQKRKEINIGTTIPENWKNKTNTSLPIETGWIQNFNDPDLESVVAEAIAHNQDLKSTAARLQIALAESRKAGSELYPKLNLQSSGSKEQTLTRIKGAQAAFSPTTFDQFLRGRRTSLGLSLDLSWEVDLWGRIRASKAAAKSDSLAAAADYEYARLSLAAQTAKAWFATVESKLQYQLAKKTAKNFQATTEIVQNRFERGLSPAIDLYLAKSNESNAKALVAETNNTYQTNIRALEILLGRYPSTQLKVIDRLAPVPPPIPVGIPATLLERRPDLKAAEERLAAADKRVWQAKADRLPRISLTATGGTTSDAIRDLVDPKHNIWNIAVNLVQPLFEGGRLAAEVDRSRAQSYEALAQYAQTALQAFKEVEDALSSEEFLLEQEKHLKAASDEATSAYQLAEDKYSQGLETITTVLEAQRRSFDNQREYLRVKRVRLENRVNLHLSLGGDFNKRELDPSTRTATVLTN